MASIDDGRSEPEQAFTRAMPAQSRVGVTPCALPVERRASTNIGARATRVERRSKKISMAEAVAEMSRAQQAQQVAIAAAGRSQKASLKDYLR